MSKKTNLSQLPDPDIKNKWVNGNTAILVIHGIGHQNPLETVDQFGRTLIKTFENQAQVSIKVSHNLSKKEKSDGRNYWFDNYLSFKREDKLDGPAIDLYEYYWANKTEDKATIKDIIHWTSSVSKGAGKFYKEREESGIVFKDKSIFFDSRGRFNYYTYRVVLHVVAVILPGFMFLLEKLISAFNYLPFFGLVISGLLKSMSESALGNFANVIGDIVVYNSTDRKSKFYNIRKDILAGAVNALRHLIEPDEFGNRRYSRVILVGHSLGTQVAYDSVNRLVHLVNFGEVNGWSSHGRSTIDDKPLSEVFSGFITFGSPLDKIAFFLRENVPQEQYLRKQMLGNFHAFRYRPMKTNFTKPLEAPFAPLLDDIKWINFHDGRDWVSGSLEYYANVINMDCWFTRKLFTHSAYWNSERMFQNIIHELLVN